MSHQFSISKSFNFQNLSSVLRSTVSNISIPMLLVVVLFQSCSSSKSIFILSPSQSMSITGKGEGQDAAINPYSNMNSIAVVKNLGDNEFNVRVQRKGKSVEDITILPKKKQEIELLKGSELYLDSTLESKAEVKFKRSKN